MDYIIQNKIENVMENKIENRIVKNDQNVIFTFTFSQQKC